MSQPAGQQNTPWTCTLKQPEQWTVGTLTSMDCSGDAVTEKISEQLPQIQFANKDDAHKIKIIEVKKFANTHAEFLVTSYKPGDHQNLSFEIVLDAVLIPIKPVSFTVQSVLNPQQPSEAQGPYGPYILSYPIWVWLLALFLLAAIGAAIFYPIRRRKKNIKMIEEMSAYKTPIPASHQLRKDFTQLIRNIEKKSMDPDSVEAKLELSNMFKSYLIRQFFVPAHVRNYGYCEKQIAKKFPRASLAWIEDLKRAATEVKNISQGSGWTVSDYEQLSAVLTRLTEKIHASLLKETGRSSK